MKRLFTTFVCAAMAALSFAQSYPANGYYRVQNKGTERYVYVADNVGSINMATTTAELGAMLLWKDPAKRYSDPGSVIYFQCVDNANHKYDVQSQGTGAYAIIGHYLQMNATGGGYELYAQQGSTARYLGDIRKSKTREDGEMGTSATGDYRIWYVTPVDVNSSEYFGIKPVVSAGGKYYHPFYAAFPFKFASAGMKAYYIKTIDTAMNVAVLEEYNNDVMAGGVPYIIECSSEDPADNRLEILTSGGTAPSDNKLKGNYFFNPKHVAAGNNRFTEFDSRQMRLLEVNASGKLVFSNNSSRLESDTYTSANAGKKYLPANQCYLPVANGTPANLSVIPSSEYTGISEVVSDEQEVSAVYSLSGERVAVGAASLQELPAGIYVIGGRKVQVR